MIMLSVRFCVHCWDLCSFLCRDCRQLVFQLILKWCLLSMELRSEDTRVHSRIKYISVLLESLIFVIRMFNFEFLMTCCSFLDNLVNLRVLRKWWWTICSSLLTCEFFFWNFVILYAWAILLPTLAFLYEYMLLLYLVLHCIYKWTSNRKTLVFVLTFC